MVVSMMMVMFCRAVPKRVRLLTPPLSPSSATPPSPLTACLSPNAGCVAIATKEFIHQLHLGSHLLGVKGRSHTHTHYKHFPPSTHTHALPTLHTHTTDSAAPEVSRCSRLLSLATVTQQSPWDLVVMLARVDNTPAFLQRVLTHYQADYQNNSSTVGEHLQRHYFTTCSLIHR